MYFQQILSTALILYFVFHQSQSLSDMKLELLSTLRPCIIHSIRLANSIPASDTVDPYLQFYLDQNPSITETVPTLEEEMPTTLFERYKSKFHTTRQTKIKFLFCYAILYFQDEIFKTYEWGHESFLVFAFKPTVYIRRANPSTIIYITKEPSEPINEESRVHELVGYIFVTSTFYVIDDGNQKCFMICTLCGNSQILFQLKTNSDLTDLKWRQIHTSTLEIPVFAGVYDWRGDSSTCEVYRFKLGGRYNAHFPDASHCFLRLLRPYYNLTSGDIRGFPRSVHALRYPLTSRTVKDNLLGGMKETTEFRTLENIPLILPYGLKTEPFRFCTVVRPEKFGFDALTKPFDTQTWIFLIISTMLLGFYVFSSFKHTQNSSLVLYVFSILVEQGQDVAGERTNFGSNMLAVLIIWLLITIVISNGYKGVLFTLLTMSKIPWTPTSVQELVESKIFLTTVTGIGNPQGGAYSLAIDELTHIIQEEEAVGLDTNRTNMLLKLRDSVQFIDSGRTKDLFVAIGRNYISENLTVIPIPSEFTLLDYDYRISFFSDLIGIYTDKLVILGDHIPMLTMWITWYVERTAFIRLIYKDLKAVHESGIFSRWDYYNGIQTKYHRMLTALAMARLNDWKSAGSRNIPKASVLAYLMYKPFDVDLSTPPEVIYMVHFTVFMLLIAYCLLICCILYIVEWVRFYGLRDLLSKGGEMLQYVILTSKQLEERKANFSNTIDVLE